MNHPKCKTCNHFDPEIQDWDNPLNFGFCRAIAESWEMSDWDFETSENKFKQKFKDHLASVSDGSSYSASLNVHPNFYCPMHSELMPNLIPYRER